jgi:hypothetical protein
MNMTIELYPIFSFLAALSEKKSGGLQQGGRPISGDSGVWEAGEKAAMDADVMQRKLRR